MLQGEVFSFCSNHFKAFKPGSQTRSRAKWGLKLVRGPNYAPRAKWGLTQ